MILLLLRNHVITLPFKTTTGISWLVWYFKLPSIKTIDEAAIAITIACDDKHTTTINTNSSYYQMILFSNTLIFWLCMVANVPACTHVGLGKIKVSSYTSWRKVKLKINTYFELHSWPFIRSINITTKYQWLSHWKMYNKLVPLNWTYIVQI